LYSNSKFKAALQQLQAESHQANLDLDSYLIKPCQRLPRYILLLDAVLKHTPEYHVDFLPLKKVSEEISKVVTTINEKKREDEDKQKVLQLASKLNCPSSLELVQPARRFLMQGSLSEVSERNLRYQSKQNRTAFLFNDLLLLAKSKMIGSSYNVTTVIPLPAVTAIREIPESNGKLKINLLLR
jgi:hypothetical protein